jgi:hypothetical protein
VLRNMAHVFDVTPAQRTPSWIDRFMGGKS